MKVYSMRPVSREMAQNITITISVKKRFCDKIPDNEIFFQKKIVKISFEAAF